MFILNRISIFDYVRIKMKKRIRPKVKEILENAIVEAESFDDTLVKPEHIFYLFLWMITMKVLTFSKF